MKTRIPSEEEVRRNRKWWVVDVSGKVLGRQATEIAHLLRGKHKPEYVPFIDSGDFVVVINVDKIKLTGKKLSDKYYYWHSGYPGGIKEMVASEMMAKKPDQVLRKAVKGMLPKGALGHRMLKKLKIYVGPEHPHQAQQPDPIDF